jgi:outer membrane receptor protein involved in Fe transport
MSLTQYLSLSVSALALSLPMSAIAQTSEQDTSSPQNRQQAASASSNEIVVTATRRDESILDVPLSVTAYSQQDLDIRGVRNIEDLVRMTPGVSLNQGTLGIKYLVIRGLTSSVGATMNGVYIDDTPVQVRSLSVATNFYPAMFDLDRIEVLRGPQGTLFGAGAMGGAIRFISAQPDFDDYSGYGRAEVGFTEGGDPSYEGGAALGGPIIGEKLAFRVSGYYRHDGGYIDRVPYLANWGSARKNHNTRDTYVGQAQLAFKPTEDSTITAGVFYQQADRDNTDEFWESRPGAVVPLSATSYPEFTNGDGIDSFGRDRAILYSVKGEFDLGPATLITNTAFLNRDANNREDVAAFFKDLFGLPQQIPLDTRGTINLNMRQDAFTQELRIQSNPSDSPISYVAGLFYQNSRQRVIERDVAADPATFIVPTINGVIGFGQDFSRDRQFAVFGNIDYKLTDTVTMTAGVRYSYVTYDFRQRNGYDLPTDTVRAGRTAESPITPKFGIEYTPNDNLMLYANAAKGFRPGGTNSIPTNIAPACGDTLQALGYPDRVPPSEYRSDSTWAYEIGAKGRVGSWLTFAGDVFRIDWDDVQRTRAVLNCANPFIDNLGKSRAQGVEAKVTVRPVAGLSLDGSFSYTDATAQETIRVPVADPNAPDTVVTKGDRFAPPWIISAAADYETAVGMGDAVGYGRVQWDHRSGWTVPGGNIGFTPLTSRIPARDFVAARVGVRTGGTDISLYVNNLLDSRDELGRLVLGGGAANRMTRQVYRPRTFGVTATHRF